MAVGSAKMWQTRGHWERWAPLCVQSSRCLCELPHWKQSNEPSMHPISPSNLASYLAKERGHVGMMTVGQPTHKTGCMSPILIPNHSQDKVFCLQHTSLTAATQMRSNSKLPPAHWDTRASTGCYYTVRQLRPKPANFSSSWTQATPSHYTSMLTQNCWLIKGQFNNDLCISDIRDQINIALSRQHRKVKGKQQLMNFTNSYLKQLIQSINLIETVKKNTFSFILTAICNDNYHYSLVCHRLKSL